MHFPLVSSKAFIGELFSDFNLEGTDWLTKVHRHISRGMELMRCDGYFVREFKKTEVIDYKAELPCSSKYLIGAVYGDGADLMRLPIRTEYFLGKTLEDIPITQSIKAVVQNNHISTSFETGTIGLLYYTTPVDTDGMPMVIDNAFVLDALPFYIIMKLGYSGYTHPVVTRQEAEEKWERLSIVARHDVNYPSLEDMQQLIEVTNNPYLGDYLNNLASY